MMSDSFVIRVEDQIAAIAQNAWDAAANPDTERHNPFVSHAFLKTLEDAKTVGGRTGWLPQHLVLQRGDSILGVMPLYVKTHSQGEYVFDHAFADALHRAGGRYYPKLQCAVPFSPVPGPRILVKPAKEARLAEAALANGAVKLAKELKCSSLHVTFAEEVQVDRLTALGFLRRTDQQFHWHNANYTSFEDFLGALASRKRKTIRKERADALATGLTIEHVSGRDIQEHHWDAFYEFYEDTGNRKWGRPYLNRKFFSLLSAAMADRCLLIFARNNDRYVAGALNLIGGDCLYGRYWGAIEQHPCLHFEICYYQAIEWAIAHRIKRVEAGAQGAHKIARGYLPATTYSAHWFAEPQLHDAVARYLDRERQEVSETAEFLTALGPFRKTAVADHD